MTEWDTAAWPAPSTAVAAMVERAPLQIAAGLAAAMTAAGGWCGQALAAQAARLGIMAWAMAAGGDDSLLLRIGDAQQAGFLLHPYRKDWVIAPGPVVTRISIWQLETHGPGAARMKVSWDFTGAQRYDGPVAPPGWRGPGDWEFTGMLTLELTGDEPFPWRLTSGHVDSLDHVLGYPFLTRDETPGEYRARTGSAPSGPAAGAVGPLPAHRRLRRARPQVRRLGDRGSSQRPAADQGRGPAPGGGGHRGGGAALHGEDLPGLEPQGRRRQAVAEPAGDGQAA